MYIVLSMCYPSGATRSHIYKRGGIYSRGEGSHSGTRTLWITVPRFLSRLFLCIQTKNYKHKKNMLLLTYLYVYGYDNILKDRSSKFPKSPKCALIARIWKWRGIGMVCNKNSLWQLLVEKYNCITKRTV